MSKFGKVLLILVLLFFIGGIIGLKTFNKNTSDNVKTIQAKRGDIIVKDYISGEVVYAKEVLIKPQISGILKNLYVKEGQSIKKGDKIAKIKVVANPSTVEISDDKVKKAKVNFDLETKNYHRQKELFETGVIARNKMEQAERNYLLAEQALTSAKEQYFIANQGYSKKTRTSNLVFSTTSGEIINLPLEEGASVIERNNFNEGSTLAVIGSADEVIFKGQINEKDLFNIKEEKLIKIELRAIPNKKLDGKIISIAEKATLVNGVKKFAFKASIVLQDSLERYIRSGLTAKASIVLEKRKNVLTLPENNVIYKNDSTYVKILKKNKVVKKVIKTGLSDGKKVEVTYGLSKKDKVVKE